VRSAWCWRPLLPSTITDTSARGDRHGGILHGPSRLTLLLVRGLSLMNRRALSPVLVAAAMLAPTRALAQLETPKMPAPLPVETTALLWVKWEDVQARYARAGTKPLQYRLGRDPTFESAPWQSFQEGPRAASWRLASDGSLERCPSIPIFTWPFLLPAAHRTMSGTACSSSSGFATRQCR
jgi:hypothetical protein